MALKINSYDRFDLVNAINSNKPAFTIWFQGCDAACIGCHNPSLWKHDVSDRHKYQPDDILDIISRQNFKYDDVVLLGGEPLEQDIDQLTRLVRSLHKRKYKIWLYTGWEMEQIPADIADKLYFVKTGRYIEELRTDGFPSSSNQKMYINTGTRLKQIKEVDRI